MLSDRRGGDPGDEEATGSDEDAEDVTEVEEEEDSDTPGVRDSTEAALGETTAPPPSSEEDEEKSAVNSGTIIIRRSQRFSTYGS